MQKRAKPSLTRLQDCTIRWKRALQFAVAVCCLAAGARLDSGSFSPLGRPPVQAAEQAKHLAAAKFLPPDIIDLSVLRYKSAFRTPLGKAVLAALPTTFDEVRSSTPNVVKDCEFELWATLPDIVTPQASYTLQSMLIQVFESPLDEAARTRRNWSERVQLQHGSYWREPEDDDGILHKSGFFPAASIAVTTDEEQMERVMQRTSLSAWGERVAALPGSCHFAFFVDDAWIGKLRERVDLSEAPPEVRRLVESATSAQFLLFLDDELLARLTIKTRSNNDALVIAHGLPELREFSSSIWQAFLSKTSLAEPFDDLIKQVLASVEIRAENETLHFDVRQPENFVALAAGPAAEVVRTVWAEQKLEGIADAVREYRREHHVFPPDGSVVIRDADGRPRLSWRVMILPQLGYQELYDRFRLLESWNSDHNKELLLEVPDVYICAQDLPKGTTNVLAPYGEGTVLGGVWENGLRNITDRQQHTLMVFEGTPEQAVPWTKPDDFEFDPTDKNAMARFGHPNSDIFLGVSVTGSVHLLKKGMPAQVLQSFIDVSDGYDFNLEDYVR